MTKICFITGTRADYGLLKPVIDEVRSRAAFDMQLIATGTHLSRAYGYTLDEIERDGLTVNAKVEMLADGDNSRSVIKSMSRELSGLAHELDRLKPDLMVIPGDRYEMLAAASACLISRIPIAHIFGGDITEGAFDDSIRHAITKMSHLHFVTTEDARRRVIQMGEQQEYVHNTGSPSLDKIKTMKPLSKEELHKTLGITFRENNLLVTFHPETLARQPVSEQVEEFTAAISALGNDYSIIITMPNADPEGQKIRDALEAMAKDKDNIYLFDSLGYQRYFSLMSHASAVVGNSSSGLYEAPSFKIPTVNIGNRQKGRVMADSVINVECTKDAILAGIDAAKTHYCAQATNPYGNGGAAKRIVDVLEKYDDPQKLLIKKFYDIHNS